jgi:hypothetical protein
VDFVNTKNAYGQSVAVANDGNVIVAGGFTGAVDFGGGPVSSFGSNDIFVAEYSTSGIYQWARHFGNTGSNYAYGVAVDSTGNVFVTGAFQGTVDFGSGPLTSSGSYDIFVAKYSSSGVNLWSKRFGGSSSACDYGYGISVDNNGNVLLTGFFSETVNFGGGTLTFSGYGPNNVFVAKLSGLNGSYIWAKNFPINNGTNIGYSIATDSSGNVFVTGVFQGGINFGGSTLMSIGMNNFLLKLAGSNGAYLWSKTFVSTGNDYSYSVSVDSGNDVVMTGYFMGSINFGGGTLSGLDSVSNGFLAKFSGVDGSHLWSKGYVAGNGCYGNGVATDKYTNDVVTTGTFYGTVDFGGGPQTSAGYYVYIVKYSSAGNFLWSKIFGYPVLSAQGNSVAMDGGGNTVATGVFHYTVDFGGGPQTSAGGSPYIGDIFLVKFGQ